MGKFSPPRDFEQYQRLAAENCRFSGIGLGVRCHLACPFCAAPDFIEYNVLDVEKVMADGATCRECGRSARGITKRPDDGSVRMEIIQTGGDDPPAWLMEHFPMRRETVA